MEGVDQQIYHCIESTLSPDPNLRSKGERTLRSLESQQGFSSLLLHLISLHSIPIHIRQAASVYLKNSVKRNWESNELISNQDKSQLKSNLITIMLQCPSIVRKQLSEMLSIIAEQEFPQSWPDLLPELTSKLNQTLNALQKQSDSVVWETLQGLLYTLQSLFDRYRYKFRSDELFTEIKYSLELIQVPLTQCFGLVSEIALHSKYSSEVVSFVFDVLESCVTIFHSLCWQDLPEYFEDHMNQWMNAFLSFLSFENAQIEGSIDDLEPSCVDKLHAVILEVCDLYERKYEEEFRPYLQNIISACWSLLVKRGSAPKYDLIATRGIAFLTTVSKSPDFGLFQDVAILQQICEKIVIPNVELRDEDEELFEDNPLEYIRRDMEGSDAESRRRSAVELVKGLLIKFEEPVTKTFSAYVNSMLTQYASNPSVNWKSKDSAVYIVTALGWKSGTQTSGATETSRLVDIVDFFKSQIAPELISASSNSIPFPVLIADAIRFTTLFRNQIPTELLLQVVNCCQTLLACPIVVIHSYAAICIERLLTVKDQVTEGVTQRYVLRFGQVQLLPILPTVLASLFALIAPGKPENEYVMRCVLRVIVTSQTSIAPQLSLVIGALKSALERACSNPANPRYNHYLFDSIACLVKVLGPMSVEMLSKLEELLFGTFQIILANDIVEFGPYVLQILAQMLSLHLKQHEKPLPNEYTILLPALLTPTLWDRSGYIPGMVQYLDSFIRKNVSVILSSNQLIPILGIFQKLIASKAHDHYGLSLISALVQCVPLDTMKPYLIDILKVLVIRLQTGKTVKYTQKLLCFLSIFVVHYGTEVLASSLDSIQPQLLLLIIQQVWIKDVVSIGNFIDRKCCAIGSASLLTSKIFISEPYSNCFGVLLNVTIALLEGIQSAVGVDGSENEEIDVNSDNAVAYSQLAHALQGKSRDPFPQVDARKHLAQCLSQWSLANPGKLEEIVKNSVEPAAQQALQNYMTLTTS